MKLAYTRAIIDAIHSGELASVPTVVGPHFGLHVPTSCPGLPAEILVPKQAWRDQQAYEETARKLAGLFANNFKQFADGASAEVLAAGPKI